MQNASVSILTVSVRVRSEADIIYQRYLPTQAVFRLLQARCVALYSPGEMAFRVLAVFLVTFLVAVAEESTRLTTEHRLCLCEDHAIGVQVVDDKVNLLFL